MKTLSYGIHSGNNGGIVADSFFVLRKLLDRLEDSKTGILKEKSLFPDIPEIRINQMNIQANIVKEIYIKSIPFYGMTKPLDNDIATLIKRNTWCPALAIIGGDGFPEASISGNVLRPFSTLKLSIRVPPLIDTAVAVEKLSLILKENPPYNVIIETTGFSASDGWNLNEKNFSSRLTSIINKSSLMYFNEEVQFCGQGCSIPFVQCFSINFPLAELIVLGVTGPASNCHGPDENLDLDYTKKLICCLTNLIKDY